MELDKDTRNRLSSQGFLHLEGVFGAEHLKQVEDLLNPILDRFDSLRPSRANRLDEGESSRRIRDVNNACREVPGLRATEVFRRAKEIARQLLGVRGVGLAFDHAIYKDPGTGPVRWHQDQAYKSSVPRMRSVHLWIPLHSVDRENGCMQFVGGSHLSGLMGHRSATNSGNLTLDPPTTEPYTAETRLGDLCVHLPLTVHRSLPNGSSRTRKAWILHFSRFGRWEVITPRNLVDLVQQRFGLGSFSEARRG